MNRAASILILSLASVTSLLAATIAFLAPPVSPLGDYDLSSAMVAADFNRDGRDDVAVNVRSASNGDAFEIKIMLADENGVLQAGVSFPTVPAKTLAVGDFNGDGNADILIPRFQTTAAGSVDVALGHGDGTFTLAPAAPAERAPTFLAVADFDGDSTQDFAVSNTGESSVGILRGIGDGTFTYDHFGVAHRPYNVVALLLDGDGSPDLAVLHRGLPELSLLFNNGDGTFRLETVTLDAEPSYLLGGDFNADGKDDLVISDFQARVFFLQGNGDGTLQPQRLAATGGLAVVSVDLDGNGILDLAARDLRAGVVRSLLGTGDGTFVVKAQHALFLLPDMNMQAAGDFNGDGHVDLAAAAESVVTVLPGVGDGSFVAPRSIHAGLQHPLDGRIADMNNDGVPDLVIAAAGATAVRVGTGGGAFAAPLSYEGGASPTGAVILGDFNSDGNLDVVGRCQIRLGTGTGALQPPIPFPCPRTPNAAPTAADFNLDGKLDVVLTSGAGTVFYPGNGDGTLGPYRGVASGDGAYIVTADFNTDAKPDILLTLFSADRHLVVILLGNGDGSFVYLSTIAEGPYQRPAIGDFNADGIPDIAIGTAVRPARVEIMLGAGDGTFQQSDGLDVPQPIRSTAIADFDADGRDDLAFTAEQLLYVAAGNGDGTVAVPIRYPVSGTGATAGDYDGDGKLDLVLTNFGTAVHLVRNISQ